MATAAHQSLASQVSVDAAPCTPTGSSGCSRIPPLSNLPSAVSCDALAGNDDASHMYSSRLPRQQVNQQREAQPPSEGVSREEVLPVGRSVPTERNNLIKLDLKSKDSDSLKSTDDSSYGSMNSNESCSSLSNDNWLDELKKYEKEMPPDIRMGFLDVLILYHEDDRDAAEQFRQHLMNDIEVENGPIKTMLYDDPEMVAICGSLIGHLDQAVQRSTYVFIYMTKTFVSDKWCEFQSESCLMEAITNPKKMWCVVPVYTEKRNASFRVPMGLNTLKGINYYNNDKFYRKGVARLIGDKINVRIRADKDHRIKQKVWLEEYKRKQLQQEEQMRRVAAYQEKKTRDAEEWIKQETEKLIEMGVIPAPMLHSASESDIPNESRSIHHSHSTGSLKPVQPQNPAVQSYFQELLDQNKKFGYNYHSYTDEQLKVIEEYFSRNRSMHKVDDEYLQGAGNPFNRNITSFPSVRDSAVYEQTHRSVNRTTSLSGGNSTQQNNAHVAYHDNDIPIELLKRILHLSVDDQEKYKQEYFKVYNQQNSQSIPSQPLVYGQQGYDGRQASERYTQRQPAHVHQTPEQSMEDLHVQDELYKNEQAHANRSFSQPGGSNASSVHTDMPVSTYGHDSGHLSGEQQNIPLFDQLNSRSSVGGGQCYNSDSMSSGGLVRNSERSSGQVPYRYPGVSQEMSSYQNTGQGNLPNYSLLDGSQEMDGPSSPVPRYQSAPVSRVPESNHGSTQAPVTKPEPLKEETKSEGKKKKEKKVVKHVTINVYQAHNVQIGDQNVTNETETVLPPDSDDDDDDDDIPIINAAGGRRNDRNSDRSQLMKKVEVPSGTRSHAELGPQTGAGPCTVDAAPSTVPNVKQMSSSPGTQSELGDISDTKDTTARKLPVDNIVEEAEEAIDDETKQDKEKSGKSSKIEELEQSAKSVEKSDKFDASVNMNSSKSEKPSESIRKVIPTHPTPNKPIAACKPLAVSKPQVAFVSPLTRNSPNDNEDVTCLKTVVESSYTERKYPVSSQGSDIENSQTLVKQVAGDSVNCECESDPGGRNIAYRIENKTNESAQGITPVVNTDFQGFSVSRDAHNLFYTSQQKKFFSSVARGTTLGADGQDDSSLEVTFDLKDGEDVEDGFEFVSGDEQSMSQSSSMEESGGLHDRKWRRKGTRHDDKDCCIS